MNSNTFFRIQCRPDEFRHCLWEYPHVSWWMKSSVCPCEQDTHMRVWMYVYLITVYAYAHVHYYIHASAHSSRTCWLDFTTLKKNRALCFDEIEKLGSINIAVRGLQEGFSYQGFLKVVCTSGMDLFALARARPNKHTHTRTHAYIYIHAYINIHAHTYIHVHIKIHTHTYAPTHSLSQAQAAAQSFLVSCAQRRTLRAHTTSASRERLLAIPTC